jgi:hypothetical protein
VTFDRDNAAAIQRLRQERGVGVSVVVNDLVRQATATTAPRRVFRQRTADLGAILDVRNTAEALEVLEGPARR